MSGARYIGPLPSKPVRAQALDERFRRLMGYGVAYDRAIVTSMGKLSLDALLSDARLGDFDSP